MPQSNLDAVGLIGQHAYGVIDVVAAGCEKLLKLRNPWGDVVWKGDWSEQSKRWTPEWRRRLDNPQRDKTDGVFWIAYADFLAHFATIDVCKEQSSWYSLNTHDLFAGAHLLHSAKMYELRAAEPTWMFVSLIQRSKRGESSKYEYQVAPCSPRAGRDGAKPGEWSAEVPRLGRHTGAADRRPADHPVHSGDAHRPDERSVGRLCGRRFAYPRRRYIRRRPDPVCSGELPRRILPPPPHHSSLPTPSSLRLSPSMPPPPPLVCHCPPAPIVGVCAAP